MNSDGSFAEPEFFSFIYFLSSTQIELILKLNVITKEFRLEREAEGLHNIAKPWGISE